MSRNGFVFEQKTSLRRFAEGVTDGLWKMSWRNYPMKITSVHEVDDIYRRSQRDEAYCRGAVCGALIGYIGPALFVAGAVAASYYENFQ